MTQGWCGALGYRGGWGIGEGYWGIGRGESYVYTYTPVDVQVHTSPTLDAFTCNIALAPAASVALMAMHSSSWRHVALAMPTAVKKKNARLYITCTVMEGSHSMTRVHSDLDTHLLDAHLLDIIRIHASPPITPPHPPQPQVPHSAPLPPLPTCPPNHVGLGGVGWGQVFQLITMSVAYSHPPSRHIVAIT